MEKPPESEKNMQGIQQEWVSTLDTHTLTQFLESIIYNAKLWMTFLDTNRNVVIWNRAAQEITGYSAEEVLGHNNVWKWIYPDASYRKDVTHKIIENIHTKKSLENFETSIVTKNRETKKISWNTRELVGEDKKSIGFIVLGNDITEIAKAKSDIRRYAEFQESIIINAKLWMTFLDTNNQVIIWNKAAEEITGYTKEEVIGHSNVWKWLYPDPQYRHEVTKMIRDIISNNKYLENIETRILTKQRMIRYISWNTRELTGDDKKPIGYIIVGNDITEKLLAKKELKEHEEMFRGIASSASDAIALLDRNGVISYWNPAAEKLFDASSGSVFRKNFFSLFSPEKYRNNDKLDLRRYFETAFGPFALKHRELQLQKITGNVIQAEISLSTVTIHGVLNAIAVIRDIRERLETEIREREIQINEVIQGSPVPQFMLDTNHKIIFWNRALEEYTGMKAAEVVGTNQHWRAFYETQRPCLADLLIDGTIEDIPKWYSGKYNKSRLVKGAYEATDFFPKMGSEGTWLFFTAAIIRDAKGSVLGVLETLEDITDAIMYKPR
ncbi:MAG TPA: PAS domain-containing protein [Methanoregula sp.]|nr:PAS domain-containing protein [Methanoregula sp.]